MDEFGTASQDYMSVVAHNYRALCAINSTKGVLPGWGMLATMGFSAIGSE
jgi:hypothetical protein